MKKEEYSLPSKVSLSTYGFFDPIYAEQLVEPPLKSFNMWNDSLLSLCGIFNIEIIHRGIKSPEDLHEKSDYQFNRIGLPVSYSYFNFELSSATAYTKAHFTTDHNGINTITIPIFFGLKEQQKISVKQSSDRLISVRTKKNLVQDSSIIIYKNTIPVVYIDKLGDFVSKVHFVLDIHKSLSELKSIFKVCNIKPEEFLLAEKIVTFTEAGFPQKSYHISENFIKGELIAEWIYENNKKLTHFRKYINNHIVKDFSFVYSEDKVLRSFTYNRKQYEIHYN
jgi:hypothetical protein